MFAGALVPGSGACCICHRRVPERWGRRHVLSGRAPTPAGRGGEPATGQSWTPRVAGCLGPPRSSVVTWRVRGRAFLLGAGLVLAGSRVPVWGGTAEVGGGVHRETWLWVMSLPTGPHRLPGLCRRPHRLPGLCRRPHRLLGLCCRPHCLPGLCRWSTPPAGALPPSTPPAGALPLSTLPAGASSPVRSAQGGSRGRGFVSHHMVSLRTPCALGPAVLSWVALTWPVVSVWPLCPNTALQEAEGGPAARSPCRGLWVPPPQTTWKAPEPHVTLEKVGHRLRLSPACSRPLDFLSPGGWVWTRVTCLPGWSARGTQGCPAGLRHTTQRAGGGGAPS